MGNLRHLGRDATGPIVETFVTPVKYASPLLNTLRCHWHEFNLAGCPYREFHGAGGVGENLFNIQCRILNVQFLSVCRAGHSARQSVCTVADPTGVSSVFLKPET